MVYRGKKEKTFTLELSLAKHEFSIRYHFSYPGAAFKITLSDLFFNQ